MGRPGTSAWWRWLLFVCLSLRSAERATAEPQFLVAVPAVVESGTTVQFCFSLLQLTEDLTLTVSLESNGERAILYRETHSSETHTCTLFEAPVVENQEIRNFEVELQGQTFNSKETRKIQIRNYGSKTFIQTDKPIYLPGQTVHFRVVTLDSKLRPAVGLYNVIELQDTRSNRIGQWLDRSSEGKILQLSYDLNSEAKEGPYSISVSIKGSKVTHWFKVEKYVLPKFSVKLKAPSEVSIGLEELTFEVCAKYTFGQSVPGTVEAQMCRFPETMRHYQPELNQHSPVCHKEQKQVGKDGCSSFSFNTSPFINGSRMRDEYNVRAIMIEEGTDVKQPVEQRIQISYQIGKVMFVDPPGLYDVGAVLDLKVKAVHFNDSPVTDTLVYLMKRSDQVLQSLKTDHEGFATFKCNTTDFPGHANLKASLYKEYIQTYRNPHFAAAYHHLSEAQAPSLHTKTVSSVEIQGKDRTLVCGSEEDFSVQYTVVGEKPGTAHIMYLVLSRGAIIKYGHESVEIKSDSVLEGQVSFKLEVTPEMAPVLQVVAYAVLPSDSVIAKAKDFSTEKCFSNKVSLEFSPSSSVPAEDSTLKVTALPHSLCGLSAVDQSVLIKEPGKTLDQDKIFHLLPVQKAQGFPYQVEDPLECLKLHHRRSIAPPYMYRPDRNNKDDAYQVFKGRGLKMATNLFIQTPSCVNFRGTEYHRYFPHHRLQYHPGLRGGPLGPAGPQIKFEAGSAPLPPPIQTVRTFFPETWIWDLVDVGESGSTALSLTVPDTITTWETEAFCLSPLGFGLAPRENLTVFQPFFLELTMPYSIIRGESFELKATVFNYLSSCIMVSVTAAPSLDYTLTPLSGEQYTCLCGNERKTLSWMMVPSVLGVVKVSVKAEAIPSQVQCDNEIMSVPERERIDVVTKPLIVKAEGTEMAKAFNWLLCPKGEALKEEVELTLPENVIPGSARASLSVLGDILGRAMKNLDGLLKMPYGCGEQNMALLAPNIYILQYLRDTQQLTPEITERATKFLSSGYQRQLNYKHSNGAYSTFGTGDGNTWLTAFVVRCFAKAQSFVYIDPEKVLQSRTWLQSQQKEDGCFQQSGKLFNNRMKGGVSDEVTLSAYITAAFLEMNISVTDPVVSKSLSCLKNNTKNLDNTYTTALMAYVFSLAGDTETRAHLLKKLHEEGHEEGGFLHWSQTSSSTSASLSVETSSYVLLSTLSQPSVSVGDLGYASKIVRWLTGQQNPYGGFTSTQDTVVALQALALYSTLVFSPDGSSSVSVQSPSGSLSFHVDQSNKLLYQEKPLGGSTGKYSLEVTGSMCASVQISLHYNVPTPKEVNTLRTEVKGQMDCESQRPVLSLNLTSHYFGEQNSTNMVILDVKVLSGFTPDQSSLKNLESKPLVDRVEQKDDHVLIYIRELAKDRTVSYDLRLEQEMVIQNLKPAVVKIYDYYQPSDQAETEYISPCAAAAQ